MPQIPRDPLLSSVFSQKVWAKIFDFESTGGQYRSKPFADIVHLFVCFLLLLSCLPLSFCCALSRDIRLLRPFIVFSDFPHTPQFARSFVRCSSELRCALQCRLPKRTASIGDRGDRRFRSRKRHSAGELSLTYTVAAIHWPTHWLYSRSASPKPLVMLFSDLHLSGRSNHKLAFSSHSGW